MTLDEHFDTIHNGLWVITKKKVGFEAVTIADGNLSDMKVLFEMIKHGLPEGLCGDSSQQRIMTRYAEILIEINPEIYKYKLMLLYDFH
jgi:hypothetical protein